MRDIDKILSTKYGGHKLFKRKSIIKLACATMLTNAGVTLLSQMTRFSDSESIVQASSTSVVAKALGIDVASYQSADLTVHAKAGSQFELVREPVIATLRQPIRLNLLLLMI